MSDCWKSLRGYLKAPESDLPPGVVALVFLTEQWALPIPANGISLLQPLACNSRFIFVFPLFSTCYHLKVLYSTSVIIRQDVNFSPLPTPATHTHTHTHTQFFNELLLILRRDLLSRSTGDGLRQRVQSGSCSEAEMGLDVLK